MLWALDAGYTHIDTAFIYGIEDQVGKALGKKFAEGLKREDVYITTKVKLARGFKILQGAALCHCLT